MKQYDMIIKGGNLLISCGELGVRDLLIKDGMIQAAVKPDSEEAKEASAETVIDASGKLVTPGFVDSHMHDDKAMIMEDDDTTTLLDAILRSNELLEQMYAGISYDDVVTDIMERTSEVLDLCVKNGTTAVKNHVLITEVYGMAGLEAMVKLKEAYADKLDIKNIVPYDYAYDSDWRKAVDKGWVDFIGGYPDHYSRVEDNRIVLPEEYFQYIDNLFALARQYDLPLDFHCNESDYPDLTTFRYIIDSTAKHKMGGKVTCGHVTALDAKGITEEEAADAIARCAKCDVQVVSLTSCNLYLMDSGRRGPTRLLQLRDYGVDVSIASDNVRDPFRPFGNCDLIEEALLTAQVHKCGTTAELGKVMQMITYEPARNCRLEKYGVLPGCEANLVILDAPNAAEAILSHVKKNYVIHKGKVVAKNGVLV